MFLRRECVCRAAVMFCLAIVLCGGLAADDWGTFRGSFSRTGTTGENVPPTPPALVLDPAWAAPYQAGAAVTSSPVVHDGRIYFGAYNGALHCVNPATGLSEWVFSTGEPITATPTCADSVVYFTSWNGYLYSVWTGGFDDSGAPRAGQMRWRTYHAGIGGSSPLVLGDTVYVGVGSPSCEIRSYNVVDGDWQNSVLTQQPVQSSPTLAGSAIVCGSNDGRMRSLDADLVVLHERITLGSFGYSSGVSTPFGVVFVPGEEDHSLQVLNPETGQDIAVPYTTGTVSVTQGNNVVTGTGTTWISAALAAGTFKVEGDSTAYRVASVTSPTMLTLASNFAGTTNPVTHYSIQYLLPYASGYRPYHAAPGSPAVSGNFIFTQQRLVCGSSNYFYVVAVEWDGSQLLNRWLYSETYTSTHPIEPTGMCPSPAVSGDYVYSALANKVRVLQISNPVGPPAGNPPLLTPQLVASFTTPNLPEGGVDNIHGSPAVSNGRIVVVTYSGRVYCLSSANSPPPTPPQTTNPSLPAPANGVDVENNNPTISWNAVADPDGQNVSYQIQILSGSPNLEEYNAPIFNSATNSYSINALNNSHIYYRVRALDTLGAASAWSAVEHFWIFEAPPAPAPPTNFHAYSGDQRIFMSWTASPSWTVVGYKVFYRLSSEAPNWPALQFWFFPVAPWVPGLTIEQVGMPLQNYVSYDLKLHAQDGSDALSTGVERYGVVPAPLIAIGGNSYPTIEAAIVEAVPGDAIVLGAQTLNVTAPIQLPSGVSLQGQGPHLTFFRGTGDIASVVHMSAQNHNSSISMLSITGSDPATEGGAQCGIEIEVEEGGTGHVRVHNVAVFGINGHGIDVVRLAPDDPAQPPHLDLLTLVHNQGNGINVSYNGDVRVRNSIIVRNGMHGIFDSNPTPETVDAAYNDVFDNPPGNLDNPDGNYSDNVAVGPDSISQDPLFVDENGDNYLVQQGSPTIDKGDSQAAFNDEPQPNGGRVNMGVFGNTDWATQSFVFATVSSGGGGGGGGGTCFIRDAGARSQTRSQEK